MTRQRITKKLVAFATAALMLVAMVVPVVAAPDRPEGKISVYKFSGTSLANAEANTTGEVQTVDPSYEALEGAEFTLFQLDQDDVNVVNAAISANNKVARHTIAVVAGEPVVTFHMTGDATLDPPVAPYTIIANVTGTPLVETTDSAGEAFFGSDATPLADGYYVLVETDTPEGHLMAAPSLIRLPLTDTDGNPNYDIHVYPKNVKTAGIAHKNIHGLETPVSTGDTVSFELKGAFNSASVGSAADLRNDSVSPVVYGTARIIETFNAAFRYVPDSLEVRWLDADSEFVGAALTEGVHYTVTNTAVAAPGAGGEITVDLTPAGIDAAIEAGIAGFALTLDAEYVGTPDSESGAEPTAITNKMTLIVTAPGGIDEPIIDEVHVPSIAIVINKTDSDGAPLENVVFAVVTKAVVGLNYDPANTYTRVQLEDAGYIVNEAISTDADAKALIATTNAAGEIVFSNLNGYTNAGVDFWLKELATVDGFQLKTNTIRVSFDTKDNYLAANPTWAVETTAGVFDWAEGVKITETVSVENYKIDEVDPDDAGFSLPLTGGAGTLIFTVLGIIVMLGATGAYLHGKKRNA
jgi:Gram positive anchor.